jgi:hypothetical protein
MHKKLADRFESLEDGMRAIQFTPYKHASGSSVLNGAWQQWATSAENLILAVFGKESPHHVNFRAAYARALAHHGDETEVKSLIAIFGAAQEDFESGCVFNVDLRVSGEILGDFVGLAKLALAEGNKEVAAVLSCSALEDALKRYAVASGLLVDGKTMAEVCNALKHAGLVSGAQKTLLDTMPKIRNYAMHADWQKLSEPDISSVIGYVESFLLTKFSGP